MTGEIKIEVPKVDLNSRRYGALNRQHKTVPLVNMRFQSESNLVLACSLDAPI